MDIQDMIRFVLDSLPEAVGALLAAAVIGILGLLYRRLSQKRSRKVSSTDSAPGDERAKQVDGSDELEFLRGLILSFQSKYVKESYGESAHQCFTWDDLREFKESRTTEIIQHQLESDVEFVSTVKNLKGLPVGERRRLFSVLERVYKPTWEALGYISREGQTDAGQTAERMIAETIANLAKKLSE